MSLPRLFRRHAAVPNDHGSWVFLLSPLLIGLFAGGRFHVVSAYLVVAAFAGFLVRQPVTLLVKIHSGRRPRESLPAAWFWTAVYAGVGALHVSGLVLRGFGYLLLLAVPGLAVFVWYQVLISRRAERRQMLVEVLASGVLALLAPAGLWVGIGRADPVGWLLWVLVWAQSAASLVHAYMRLGQRQLKEVPDLSVRLRMATPALLITTANLALAVGLGLGGVIPPWVFVAYLPQWLEAVRGGLKPAIRVRPVAIGMRQLAVSCLYTVLFILTW